MDEITKQGLGVTRRRSGGRGPWLVTLLLGGVPLAALAACGGEVTEDAGADAASGGGTSGSGGGSSGSGGGSPGAGGSSASGGSAASGGAAGEPLCFDRAAAPACGEQHNHAGVPESTVLAVAADIVPASSFVALGGIAALLEVPHAEGAGRYRIVRANFEYGDASVDVLEVSFPEPSGAWSVLDAWAEVYPNELGLPSESQLTTLALVCDEAKCLLFGATEEDSLLSPLAGTELPPGAEVERLAVGLRSQVCAYGAEVYCLGEAGWSAPSVVPAGTGSFFADFEPAVRLYDDAPYLEPGVASTDTGVLLVEESSGVWTTLAPGSPGLGGIIALERDETYVSVLYESGSWATDVLGAQSATCVQEGGLLWASPHFAGPSAVAVDPAGALFRHLRNWREERYEWCDSGIIVDPDSFAFSVRSCGIGTTTLSLSPTTFTAPLSPPSCPVG